MIDKSDPALNLFVILSELSKISEMDNSKEIQEELKSFSILVDDISAKMTGSIKKEMVVALAENAYIIGHKLLALNVAFEVSKSRTINQYGSYVYLIHSDHGVKIGKSKTPRNRIKNVSTQMPFNVKKTESFKVNHMSNCEKYLHDYFKEKRLNGEWFDLNNKDIEFCRKFLTAKKVLETKGMIK